MKELNIIKWVDRLEDQERFRLFNYGVISCIPLLNGFIPPFQKVKPRTGAEVTEFVLIDHESGVETDILAEVVASGLEVIQPDGRNYDLVIFPSTVRIEGDFDNSVFYCRMTSGGRTWWTEFFGWRNNMNGFIKLEWCHNDDFVYNGGHIKYTESGYGTGYKNYLWIKGILAKPLYPTNKEFEGRGGSKAHTFQTSSIEYRVSFEATESVLNALRVVDQHDMVTIDQNGIVIDVDEFLFNQEWNRHGNSAYVTASIFTDEVIVETVAKGGSSGTCEVALGTCIPQTGSFYSVKTEIGSNLDNEWVMGFYYNSEGTKTDLVAGDYAILKIGPNQYELHQYNAPGDFTFIDLDGIGYSKIYIQNTNEYLYDRGDDYDIRRPRIIGQFAFVDPTTYYGETADNGITELYLEYSGGVQELIGRFTNADLQGGVVINTGEALYIVLKLSTVKCGVIMEHRYLIPLEYVVFTETDDDDSYVITADDDDDTIYLGDKDIEEVPEIL